MQLPQTASLLAPFLPPSGLSQSQLQHVSNHLDLLLQWNSKINLTSVRSAEEIVTRHFGESFFLAHTLFPNPPPLVPDLSSVDVGSGAGFPGIPLKIYAPALPVVLIESQNKKVIFLKEVVRANRLMNIDVFSGRAQAFAASRHSSAQARGASLVTLRAVEHFERILPLAASLLAPA